MFAVNAADQIMSAPVITVPVNRSVAEIQLLMMQHIGHLCDFRWYARIRNYRLFLNMTFYRLIILGYLKQTKGRKLHLNSK
jgi:hypothetical protein